MEILARETDWLPSDSEHWAAFLDTETGKRLLPEIANRMPPLLEGGDVNAILIRSGQVSAWQKMIEGLVFLAHPAAPVQQTNRSEYPPLEDDKAWADGQKLTPEKPQPTQ